jgi:hypothetical protein
VDKASETSLQKQAADALSLLEFEEQQEVLHYLNKLAEWKEDCGRRFIIAESR